MNTFDPDHERWAELAAGHALLSLDAADERLFTDHAESCAACQASLDEFSEVLADLAHATPIVAPPPALKASIMRAVLEDGSRKAPVISMTGRRQLRYRTRDETAGRNAPLARWVVGIAAAIVVLALVGVFALPGHKQASIAAQCAKVNCPVVTLASGGQSVAAVMVLNHNAYIDPHGLPATPAGDVYVLWSVAPGQAPVAVAALHTVPTSGPVKAGQFDVPAGDVKGFAVSVERGDSVPSAPSQPLLALGSLA